MLVKSDHRSRGHRASLPHRSAVGPPGSPLCRRSALVGRLSHREGSGERGEHAGVTCVAGDLAAGEQRRHPAGQAAARAGWAEFGSRPLACVCWAEGWPGEREGCGPKVCFPFF